jgi:hypothetical protein
MAYQESPMVRQVLERLYWGERRTEKIQEKPALLLSLGEVETAYAQLVEENSELIPYGVVDFNLRYWGEYWNDSHFLAWKGNKAKMVSLGIPGIKGINNDSLLKSSPKKKSPIWENFWFIGGSFSFLDYQIHSPELPPIYKAKTVLVFRKGELTA